MSIARFLSQLKGQLDPKDSVSPELYLVSEVLRIMSGETSQVIDYYIQKTQAEGNTEAYNYLSTLKDFAEDVAAGENAPLLNLIGEANGIAELDENSKVPLAQLPSLDTDWDDILNKPSEFPPEAHSHSISDVTDLSDELNSKEPEFDRMTNYIFVDGTSGSDLGSGSIARPYATIQKALDEIGSAANASEMDLAGQRFFEIKVAPGVYVENINVPLRPHITLNLDAAVIQGNVNFDYNQSIPFGATHGTPRLVIKGTALRPYSGNYATNGIIGNINLTSSNGSSMIYSLELLNLAVNGSIIKNPGVGNGFTLALFIDSCIVTGAIQDTVAGSTTLYANNCDTSSSNALGAVTGVVNLNVIRNVRFNGIVDVNSSHGRWFNVEFRSSLAHDFTGSGGTISADANSIASYVKNVPTKGTSVFNSLDTLATTTEARPSGMPVGFAMFDTTLGRPIWSDGAGGWVDADGSSI